MEKFDPDARPTRKNAYVLLADPAFLRASVLSYYSNVQRIVACFDRNSVGWTGSPIDIEACRHVLSNLDVDGKISYLSGDFSAPDEDPMRMETIQRQNALDAASEDADWVIQLDSDEVLSDWEVFESRRRFVQDQGLTALWYPQRYLFARFGEHWYFEGSRACLRTSPSRPGPLAVAAGTQLWFARQDRSERVLIDFGRRFPAIPKQAAVLHFSRIRTPEYMLRKSGWSGHARDHDWSPELAEWIRAHEQPFVFQVANLVKPVRPVPGRVKPAYISKRFADDFAPFPSPVRDLGGRYR